MGRSRLRIAFTGSLAAVGGCALIANLGGDYAATAGPDAMAVADGSKSDGMPGDSTMTDAAADTTPDDDADGGNPALDGSADVGPLYVDGACMPGACGSVQGSCNDAGLCQLVDAGIQVLADAGSGMPPSAIAVSSYSNGALFWTSTSGVPAIASALDGGGQDDLIGGSAGLTIVATTFGGVATGVWFTGEGGGTIWTCGQTCFARANGTPLVTGIGASPELAIGNGQGGTQATVYWGTNAVNGTIGYFPLGSPDAGGVLEHNAGVPNGLVADDGNKNVFWTDVAGEVKHLDLASRALTVLAAASAQANLAAIGITATTVYWTIANSMSTGGAVMSCPIQGCSAAMEVAPQQDSPRGLAVDAPGDALYWTNYGGNGAPTGSVVKCPIAACAQNLVVIASGQAQPLGIAVDDTSVYWVNSNASSGQVLKAPK